MATATSQLDTLKAIKEWKKVYVKAIIDALKPKGDVLEIGFNSGDASKEIQKHKPKSHTIIESNPKLIEEAKAFAKQNPGVTVVQENWQGALKKLKKFDAIFYNNYPLETEADIVAFLNLDDLETGAEKAKEALSLLEEKISKLKIKFTDQEVDDFLKKSDNKNLQALPKFFLTLKNNGNITEEQYKKVVEKLANIKVEKPAAKQDKVPQAMTQADPMFSCLEACIKDHMHKGSRFSAFLVNAMSRYEDAQFFGQIITNPEFTFEEKVLDINVPSPKDVKLRKALVFVVEKQV